uniref:Putative secreted protein n=1 Tax=Anopheles darlingi TaxID=43151 RepID=A0A2M4D0T3_ANODA
MVPKGTTVCALLCVCISASVVAGSITSSNNSSSNSSLFIARFISTKCGDDAVAWNGEHPLGWLAEYISRILPGYPGTGEEK